MKAKRTRRVFIDSFSTGIDDMKRSDQADPIKVLRVLVKEGRFSCFEASANPTIAKTITNMYHKGLILVQPDGGKREYGQLLKIAGGNYPWSKVVLTEGGKRLIEDNPC